MQAIVISIGLNLMFVIISIAGQQQNELFSVSVSCFFFTFSILSIWYTQCKKFYFPFQTIKWSFVLLKKKKSFTVCAQTKRENVHSEFRFADLRNTVCVVCVPMYTCMCIVYTTHNMCLLFTLICVNLCSKLPLIFGR